MLMMMRVSVTSVLLILGIFCSASWAEKVCQGTSWGLSHSVDMDARYRRYQRQFANCTLVDGNLELVFLTNETYYDLSFLKDIREISGYLLIVSIYADVVPLTSLNIVQGRTLFDLAGRNYSVLIALNFKPENQSTVGLRELQLPSLHEIEAGDVLINNNRRLCHVHTIDWTSILSDQRYNVIVNNTDTSSERCGHCSEQCELLDGQRRCWGAAADMCQTYSQKMKKEKKNIHSPLELINEVLSSLF